LANLLAWQPQRTVRVPLLWILHLSYAWIGIGFALLAAASAADAALRELALAIVAAWYTGTVAGNAAQGTKSIVVAYAEALMYRTVADGQVV
ncbi:MAG: sugar dehydrogenase complex small subunit, partial [Janthinobacterium sp.]